MADTTFDQPPERERRLGSFRRGPALFTVVQTSVEPETYRVDSDDGAGPRPCCILREDSGASPEWRGAWNRDEWCDWIEEQARALIQRPECPEL
jgi:hypothetical protein